MLNFKIGDTVIIKATLNTTNNYFKMTDEMLKYVGQKATITSFVYSDIYDPNPLTLVGYKLDIDNGYHGWEDYMFQKNTL